MLWNSSQYQPSQLFVSLIVISAVAALVALDSRLFERPTTKHLREFDDRSCSRARKNSVACLCQWHFRLEPAAHHAGRDTGDKGQRTPELSESSGESTNRWPRFSGLRSLVGASGRRLGARGYGPWSETRRRSTSMPSRPRPFLRSATARSRCITEAILAPAFSETVIGETAAGEDKTSRSVPVPPTSRPLS